MDFHRINLKKVDSPLVAEFPSRKASSHDERFIHIRATVGQINFTLRIGANSIELNYSPKKYIIYPSLRKFANDILNSKKEDIKELLKHRPDLHRFLKKAALVNSNFAFAGLVEFGKLSCQAGRLVADQFTNSARLTTQLLRDLHLIPQASRPARTQANSASDNLSFREDEGLIEPSEWPEDVEQFNKAMGDPEIMGFDFNEIGGPQNAELIKVIFAIDKNSSLQQRAGVVFYGLTALQYARFRSGDGYVNPPETETSYTRALAKLIEKYGEDAFTLAAKAKFYKDFKSLDFYSSYLSPSYKDGKFIVGHKLHSDITRDLAKSVNKFAGTLVDDDSLIYDRYFGNPLNTRTLFGDPSFWTYIKDNHQNIFNEILHYIQSLPKRCVVDGNHWSRVIINPRNLIQKLFPEAYEAIGKENLAYNPKEATVAEFSAPLAQIYYREGEIDARTRELATLFRQDVFRELNQAYINAQGEPSVAEVSSAKFLSAESMPSKILERKFGKELREIFSNYDLLDLYLLAHFLSKEPIKVNANEETFSDSEKLEAYALKVIRAYIQKFNEAKKNLVSLRAA